MRAVGLSECSTHAIVAAAVVAVIRVGRVLGDAVVVTLLLALVAVVLVALVAVVVTLEHLESPTAGLTISLAVLHHHRQAPPRALGRHPRALFDLEQIVDHH